MKTLFIVNGLPKAGKDTFIAAAREEVNSWDEYSSLHFSTIDPIKEIAISLGWDGKEKTTEIRAFLSELKTKANKLWNFTELNTQKALAAWVLDAEWDGYDEFVVFLQSREVAEIARFKENFGNLGWNVITVKVNGALEEEIENFGDQEAARSDYCYDLVLKNFGTVEEWKQKAKEMMLCLFV